MGSESLESLSPIIQKIGQDGIRRDFSAPFAAIRVKLTAPGLRRRGGERYTTAIASP
jgi:hypothetical protein